MNEIQKESEGRRGKGKEEEKERGLFVVLFIGEGSLLKVVWVP